ncbi:hypothetical protein [Oscillibacter sp.]|uniref:hypothetical protein n=1 Tax=Oscillibacter sp. TaxID=1945593 RepID=UPI002D800B7B|nr:hypothetical protein [Oscillibacter sp.]
MDEKSILESLVENSSDDVMNLIYNNVNKLLGAGSQVFAMEFPARPLNARDYEYNTDDCYSTLTKPYTVQEKEFLLSDQLYDLSPVVQGTNGERLSTVFNTVINNYVPRLEALKNFVNDQKNLREWLLTPVEDEVRGERKTMSRMAMARELYDEFLERRNEWYSKKNRVYEEYRAKDDLDGYANWLSSEGLVQEEQISNFYNDAVVRGHYHEVLTLLGFLNVSSPSEALENTKQKMRSSLRRSLDGSTDIYPVQFQPSDWFKSLRPNLSPKDLTMATESLVADYRAKQQRLRSLKALLAEQTSIEISPDERERLKTEVENRRQQLSQSQQALISQYGSGALSAVKAVIGIYKNAGDPYGKAQEVIDKVRKAADKDKQKLDVTESRIYSLLEDIADDVVKHVIESCKAQDAVLQDMNRLNESLMACSEAKVRDMTLQKQRIEEQIQSVQADLDFLAPLVSGTIAAADAASAANAANAAPALLTSSDEAQDENFMDVIIKSDESGSFSSNSTASSSSQSSWNLGGWFWSAGGSQSTQSAAETQQKKELNKKLEIGFRIKKVSIDRGGWFNPTIFKLSDNYYRLADIRVSRGLTKTDVYKASSAGTNSGAQLNALVTYDAEVNKEAKRLSYVLPSFPTGFVIAKDITIRIQCSGSSADSSRKYLEQSESRGGGIFGFRASSGSSSKSQSESAYFGSSSDFFYIRIPGPQILGWFLELTPADNAAPYQKLDPSMYSDALDALLPEQGKTGKPESGETT